MIKLGQKVRDTITGFEGIAIVEARYLNGCVQFCVKPTSLEKGKTIEGEYFDEGQLEILMDAKSLEVGDVMSTGGDMHDTPKSSYSG